MIPLEHALGEVIKVLFLLLICIDGLFLKVGKSAAFDIGDDGDQLILVFGFCDGL